MDVDIQSANYEYEYPDGLDLKPGSTLHQDTISKLQRYGWESARVISPRRDVWDAMNDKLTGFIALSDKEKEVVRKDKRKPVSIVFPYSYAILETLVSYMAAAFFPDPMFRYEGNGPEDIAGAMLMQKVIELHVARNKVALNLHTFFRDAGAYGFGVVSPQWMTETGKRTVKNDISFIDAFGASQKIGSERQVIDDVLFEGNELRNIDPYCYLPDPNYPIHEPQRGEYCGWMDRSSLMDLLLDEEIDETLFNINYLRHVNRKSSVLMGIDSDKRNQRHGRINDTINRNISDPVDILHMYVKLIPSQWNVGSSNRPEKWLFSVAGDAVIIRAQPLDLQHGKFPIAVAAPDFDGYSPVAYSRLEILSGMQTVIDWLFNSHISNVRKAINDMIVVDPFLINVPDLQDPEPGGIIRMRRPAWGRGVKDAIQQLGITDITQAHLQNVAFIINYMQQVAGIDNPLMGNLRQGGPERLSSAEFQGTARGAVSRLERCAKMIGLQGMQDIGYQFAYNTQQFMSRETYVRSVGDWPKILQEQFRPNGSRLRVEPDDILVAYDLIVRDGSIPGGNFSEQWVQLFQTIGNSELLLQRFDIVRIFEYIATQLGAKNVAEFRLQQPPNVQVSTAPDDIVDREVQAGNMIPMEQVAA